MIVIIYVYDIVVTADNSNGIQNLKSFLSKEFGIKYLGPLRYSSREFSRSTRGTVIPKKMYF